MGKNSRRLSMILALTLVLTSFPIAEKQVSAEILPELSEASDLLDSIDLAGSADMVKLPDPIRETDSIDTDITDNSDNNGPEYEAGSVIICMNTGESHLPQGKFSNDRAGKISDLLDSAEDLMDVTHAVKEEAAEAAGEEPADENDSVFSNDKAAAEEEYTLQYIHSDKYSTDQLIAMLKDDPDVLYVEPNYIYHITDEELTADEELIADEGLIADDTLVYEESSLLEESYKTNAEESHETIPEESTEISTPEEDRDILTVNPDKDSVGLPDLTGDQYAYGNDIGEIDVPHWNEQGYINAADTVVAIVDTGVDYDHEDLHEVMWDDGLLYPELTELGGGRYGYNAVVEDSNGNGYISYDPMDDHFHGTHCAGSAGAPWNGFGVSGTANGTKIMAVKAGNNKGSFEERDQIKAFNYVKTAKQAGVNVVAANNSWGGVGYSYVISLAVSELTSLGIVCCFASGNDNKNIDYSYYTGTTLWENDGIICVNANEKGGKKSSFSNHGERITDLSAPGTGIISTIPTGMGKVDPQLCTPVKDILGREARDLFKVSGTYFTYTAENGAVLDYADDQGSRVLRASNLKKSKTFLTLSSDTALADKPRYFAFSCRFDTDFTFAVIPEVLLENGGYASIFPSYYVRDTYDCENIYELPEDMDIENPTIRLVSYVRSGKTVNPGEHLYIDGISLTSMIFYYKFLKGTSMATPAVTGEVAVVASRWPDDDAAKKAARIIGSTTYVSALDGTSRTGGVANVRKALNCDYSPVVNKGRLNDDGSITISGYFFGDKKGRVSILSGDTPVSVNKIVEWKGLAPDKWDANGINEQDNIKVRPETALNPDDDIEVTVISSGNKEGSRIMTLLAANGSHENTSLFKSIPLPEDEELYKIFMNSIFINDAGLDEKLYFESYVETENEERILLLSYDPTKEDISSRWEIIEKNFGLSIATNICAWNRMLVYLNVGDSVMLYSPSEDMIYDTGVRISDLNELSYSSAYFVNADNELYLLATISEYQNGNPVDVRTELFRIDMVKKSAYHLGMLDSVQSNPVLSAFKDSSGRVIINSVSKKDETSIVSEKITINGDTMSSESGIIGLPDNTFFDNQSLTGCATQYGFVLTGPCRRIDNADCFLYSPETGTITVCDKQIISQRPGWVKTAGYGGKTYFLCLDPYSEYGYAFKYADNDEFKGRGPALEPLNDYGDDDLGNTGRSCMVVELTPEGSGILPVGRKIKITPEFSAWNNKPIEYRWYSGNALIASVDQKGNVTGNSAGETYIIANGIDADGNEYGGYCEVMVYPLITGIKLSDTRLSVAGGTTFKLTATQKPDDSLADAVEWTVSVPSSYPGAVEKTGEGMGPEGPYATFKTKDVSEKIQVKITAKTTDGSKKTATCSVTIGKPVESVNIKDAGVSLNEGKSLALKTEVLPKDALNKTLKWTSSDATVATVNDRGNIKAVGAGTCTITAETTDGSEISASCDVTIAAPVRSAAFSDTGTINLGVGMEQNVSLVRIQPAGCSPYTVSWKSSDGLVTVTPTADKNIAVIKGIKKGTAKISAVITNTAPGGKKTVTVNNLTVKVDQSVLSGNSIKIFNNKTDITGTQAAGNRLAVGKKIKLKAPVYWNGKQVNDGKVKTVWTSSDPSVASVNNGNVTAYTEGEVTLTARYIPAGGLASNPVSASCSFYVYNPVKKIRLDRYETPDPDNPDAEAGLISMDLRNLKISSGKEFALLAVPEVAATGVGDTIRETKDYTWTSSVPSVLEVKRSDHDYAVFTPKGAGKAVITCKAKDGSNKEVKCNITVVSNVTGIKITAKNLGTATVNTYNAEEITVRGLNKNKTFTISPNVEPASAANKAVTYISLNPKAVTVNNNGQVKRIGTGNADIRVTTVDGGYSAVCHVVE